MKPRSERLRIKLTRRKLALTAAVAAMALIMTSLPNVVPSTAAWLRSEWVAAPIGVVDCATSSGQFKTRGEGKLVSGGLLGFNLDILAEAKGMLVTNNGFVATANPSTAASAGVDAYANPLSVTALSAVDVDLGGGILQLPLNNSVGVLNQYGLAASGGTSIGASGFVSDSGAVATATANGYPELGSLNLFSLVSALNPTVAGTLGNVTDVSLDIGAVAGRARLDGCQEAFTGPNATNVTRDYLAAGLATTVHSPTVGALVTAIRGTVTDLQTAVNGIESNAEVKTAIQNGVTGLLAPVLGTLSIASIDPTVSATVDLTAVDAFLTQPFGDTAGIVSVSPSLGTVSVNLAALLGTAYPGVYSGQLNGLAPNTHLLVDSVVVTALTAALGQALDGWIATAQIKLDEALAAVQVTSTVLITVNLLVGTASLTASVSGSLEALQAGTVPATVTGDTVLLADLVAPLENGFGAVVGTAVNGALAPAAVIGSTVTSLLPPIVTAIGGVFTELYLNGIVTLDINAQNDPPVGNNAEPVDWATLPAGRYDVAAVRVGILDVVASNNVRLYLGRGSVGTNCVIGGLRDQSALCASY